MRRQISRKSSAGNAGKNDQRRECGADAKWNWPKAAVP